MINDTSHENYKSVTRWIIQNAYRGLGFGSLGISCQRIMSEKIETDLH